MYNLFFLFFMIVFEWMFITAAIPVFGDIYPQKIRGFVLAISTLITAVMYTAVMIWAVIDFNKFPLVFKIPLLILSPVELYISFFLLRRSWLIIKIIIQMLKINRLLKKINKK